MPSLEELTDRDRQAWEAARDQLEAIRALLDQAGDLLRQMPDPGEDLPQSDPINAMSDVAEMAVFSFCLGQAQANLSRLIMNIEAGHLDEDEQP